MTFPYLSAINLIPASGEFVYDTVAYSGMQPGTSTFHADQHLSRARRNAHRRDVRARSVAGDAAQLHERRAGRAMAGELARRLGLPGLSGDDLSP